MYKRILAPLVSHDIIQICGLNTATFILRSQIITLKCLC